MEWQEKADSSGLAERMSELETAEAYIRAELEDKEKQWREEKATMEHKILKLEQDLAEREREVLQQLKKNNRNLQPRREQEKEDTSELVEDLEELRRIEANEAVLRAELEDKAAQEWRTKTEHLLKEKATMEQTLMARIQQQQERAASLEKDLEEGRRELHEVSQQCAALQQANKELQLSKERVEVEFRGQVCSSIKTLAYNETLLGVVHIYM